MRRVTIAWMAILLAAPAALADPIALPQAPTPQQVRFNRRSPVVVAVEQVKGAVANISSTRLVRVRFGVFDDDLFNRFFPDQADPFGRTVKTTSLGSGVVIHPAGYVLTNAHVVARASEITLTFSDKSTHAARVISADPAHDLAVLKIEPAEEADAPARFPYIPMGRSDDLMIGETVIAIGNPLGYSHTVTTGVISAMGREIHLSQELALKNLVQTDASINPGNSGGPLLNINGELIGINTAIRGDAQNIGFAIPIDAARAELAFLMDFARVRDLVFGATLADADDGLTVRTVEPDSPAEAAGLAAGDRVTSVDGKPVASLLEFNIALLDKSPGDAARIAIRRGEADRTVAVKLAAAPRPDGNALLWEHFGMRVRPLDAETARKLRLRPGVGLIVTQMSEQSQAFEVGLRVGDILLAVDKLRVNGLDELGQSLKDVRSDQQVRLTILRGPYQLLVRLKAK